MKKTLKSILAMLLVCPLAYAQTAERYSDNNIEYPSFVTDISAEDISTFDTNNYVLESLEIPEYDAGLIQESDSTPTVDEILPSVNPAESFVLTSSSGGGLETFNEEDLQNPSRSVTIAQNQYLDVEYPGKGWIYLGETDNTNMMRYFGHTISSDTTFTLRAKTQGTALLHFYKIDPLTGTAINDYLEVVISGKTGSEVHVVAPSYGDIVPSGQRKKTSEQKETETQTATENESRLEIMENSQAVAENTVPVDEKSTENEELTADLDAVALEIEAPKLEVASTKSTGTTSTSSSSGSSTKSTGTASTGSSSGSSAKSTGTTSTSSGSGSSAKSTGTASTGGSGSTTKSTSTASTGGSGSSAKSTGTASTSSSSGSSTKSTGTTSTSSSSGSSTKSTGTASTGGSGSTTKSTGTASTSSSSGSSTKSNGGSQSNKNVTSKTDDELLSKAQEAYNKGNYAECLDLLTEFFNNAVTKIDEGLYLQGRALEAPSGSRNIKAALDTYETLVKRYPQSKKWNAANERVIYIKRFYFNIR